MGWLNSTRLVCANLSPFGERSHAEVGLHLGDPSPSFFVCRLGWAELGHVL